MTKNEYLITLAAKLQSFTDRPGQLYPELKRMIEFYQEMIDDKIEDGMSEEEAVAEMETPDEIADRLKKEFAEDGDEHIGSAEEPSAVKTGSVTRREYDPDRITFVRVKDSNHNIRIIRGDRIAISYEDDPNGKYEVALENGVLTLRFISEKLSFFRSIFGWKRGGRGVTVEMPNNWDGAADIRTSNASVFASVSIDGLTVHNSNGPIMFEDMTAKELHCDTSNGAITFDDAYCGNVELGTLNGRITVCGICCESIKLTTSNSSINVQDATARDLFMKSSNGGMRVQEFTGEKLHVQTSNASIKVDKLNSSDIMLITANGSITGSIIGKMQDFAITSKNSNGSNNLPDGTSGEKKLDARTANGKIAVEFVEKHVTEE